VIEIYILSSFQIENWMAPEVMTGLPYDSKADVFSLGVVCCEIVTRLDGMKFKRSIPSGFAFDLDEIRDAAPPDTPPGTHSTKIFSAVLKLLSFLKELMALIEDCCDMSPTARPDASAFLERIERIEQNLEPGTLVIRP